jgi:hypothetical protein
MDCMLASSYLSDKRNSGSSKTLQNPDLRDFFQKKWKFREENEMARKLS